MLSMLKNLRLANEKKAADQPLGFSTAPMLSIWRRRGDSNPSWTVSPLSVFKTDPFNHLGTPPERWWSIGGLNAEPGDYKSPALTS